MQCTVALQLLGVVAYMSNCKEGLELIEFEFNSLYSETFSPIWWGGFTTIN